MRSPDLLNIKYSDRWFCYIDLLGFSRLVETQSIHEVVPMYHAVLREMRRRADIKRPLGVSFSWFSDTFIIYSKGASDLDFSHVEQAGRLFFQKLILKKIPARGAITVGKLYTNAKDHVFIGEALIDAHRFGECQDWIGLLLTPMAYDKLDLTNLSPRYRPFYRRVDKPEILRGVDSTNVFAYAFNNGGVGRDNPFLRPIVEMRAAADIPFKQKYKNTEEFIRRHSATLPNP